MAEDGAGVVWLTADVHYAAARFYEPSRGAFADFVPFWEFVAGPLHAGTFGPNKVDPTFGPKVVFNSVPDNQPQNAPPSAGQQFFGVGRVNANGRVLTYQADFVPSLPRLHSTVGVSDQRSSPAGVCGASSQTPAVSAAARVRAATMRS